MDIPRLVLPLAMIGRAITEAARGARASRSRALAMCGLLASALLLLLGVSTNYWVGSTASTGAGLHGITMRDNGWYREVRFGDVAPHWELLDAAGLAAIGATYVVVAAVLLLWVSCFTSAAGAWRIARATRWLAAAALVGGAITTAGLGRYFGAPIAEGALLYLGGACLAIITATRLARTDELPQAQALRA